MARGLKRKRGSRSRVSKTRFKGKRRKANFFHRVRTKKRVKKMTLTRAMNKNTYIPRMPGGMQPSSKRIKLKYAAFFELAVPAENDVSFLTFDANGCFKPDSRNDGQPFGWDQMVLKYNSYVVTASKIRVTEVWNAGGANGLEFEGLIDYGICTGVENPLPSFLQQTQITPSVMDNSGSFKTWSNNVTNASGTWSDRRRPRVWTKSFNLRSKKKYLKEVLKTDYIIDVTGDPDGVNEPAFKFSFIRNNRAQQPLTTYTNAVSGVKRYFAEIEYQITFSNPKVLALS